MNDLDKEDVIKEFAIEVISLRPEFPKDSHKASVPDPQIVTYCESDVIATLDMYNALNGVTE